MNRERIILISFLVFIPTSFFLNCHTLIAQSKSDVMAENTTIRLLTRAVEMGDSLLPVCSGNVHRFIVN